jgi:hypothetical protein
MGSGDPQPRSPPSLARERFNPDATFFFVLLFPPKESGARICTTRYSRSVRQLMKQGFKCSEPALTELLRIEAAAEKKKAGKK